MRKGTFLFPLTLITLAGVALRFYQLNTIPPGLHYDVAANAILVEDIAIRGYRPTFISAYTGKEVLFFYSTAALYRLIGSSVFALRASAALWGIVTIPITFFALQQLLRHDRHSRWLAAFGATMLAFSFAHLVWSRFGLRAITQPPVQALAIGFLFRALRAGRTQDFWIAGIFTGLSAHTYLAARALPFVLAISTLPLLRAYWNPRSMQPLPSAKQIFGFILASGLVVAPLGIHFWEHPQEFLARISQVAPRTAEVELVWQGITAALGMIFISGEQYHRFNIPGKSLLGPLLGAMFLLGYAFAAWRLLRTRGKNGLDKPINRVAELMLIVWIPAFLLPTALAVHEVFPSTVRAFGLFPLLFALPARGMILVLDKFASLHTVQKIRLPIILLAFAGLTGALTTRNYFAIWSNLKTQHLANDGDLAHAAQFLNTREENADSIYVSAIHHQHPTMAYLAEEYEKIKWLRDARALAIPSDGSALYLFPQSAQPPSEWISKWKSALTYAPLDPLGNIDFHAYHFDHVRAIPQPEFQDMYANFGNIAKLTGFRIVASQTGQPLLVDLRLHVLNPLPDGDYRLVADLLDAWGYPWVQSFNESYPAEQWREGENIIARLEIPLPSGIPPGEYILASTLYSPSNYHNLPALDSDGRATAAALVGPLQISRTKNQTTTSEPELKFSQEFGDLQLLGYDLPLRSLRPGETLPLALYWKASIAPTEEYLVKLKLGEIMLSLSAPVHGSYPTTAWSTDEVVIDRHNPRVARNFPAGESPLSLAVSVSGHEIKEVSLGDIRIANVERELEKPYSEYPTDFVLGETFRLVGYNITTDSSLLIQLHWQSIVVNDTDYTVFVHATNTHGILDAQSDSQPADGSYPTSLWIENEFIEDTHTLTLPPGEYSLSIGMYLPTTGERLLLESGKDAIQIPEIIMP